MLWCAALLLLASFAELHASYTSLREGPPNNCGFSHYGSRAGTPQRLVETQLTPGVADWNIVVPVPPPCKNARVAGVAVRVCDTDAPPHVGMRGALRARVRRTGRLAGPATVHATVHCVLPPRSPPAPLLRDTDTSFTHELSSKELISNNETSNDSTSNELMPISNTALPSPPIQHMTTTQVESTSTTEKVTPPTKKYVHRKDKTTHTLKVTIKITPTSHESTDKVEQSHNPELPPMSYKGEPDNVISSQSPEYSVMHLLRWYRPRLVQYSAPPPLYAAVPPPHARRIPAVFGPFTLFSPRPSFWQHRQPLLYF